MSTKKEEKEIRERIEYAECGLLDPEELEDLLQDIENYESETGVDLPKDILDWYNDKIQELINLEGSSFMVICYYFEN